MRIKNREIRRRRHRKEVTIKAAIKEARGAAKPKTARASTSDTTAPKPAPRKKVASPAEDKASKPKAPAKKSAEKENAPKKPAAPKKAAAKKTAPAKEE